jgi:glyoxylase-like metal-dependent hydrolase (beta-lactamase superfamily II)
MEATKQILSSITEKLFSLPDDTFILPGHGRGSTIGISKELYREFSVQYPDLLPPIPDAPPATSE